MSSTYYNMTDPTGDSGFLPTVTFTSTNSTFTSTQRTAQLNAYGITGYYEADFADNITTIETNAFQNDLKVVVVTINQVTTINANAFDGCSGLRAITLDCAVDSGTGRYKLTSIGSYAFQNCTSLRNLHIPDTVKNIPTGMCKGCTSLEVAVMGYGCNRSEDTYIKDGSIGASAFSGCTSLSYFVVPETVGSIGDSAFENCTSMGYFAMMGLVGTVGTTVFSGAKSGSGVIYTYQSGQSSFTNSSLPTNVTPREYVEIPLNATSTGKLEYFGNTSARESAFTGVTTYWKGKIAHGITTIGPCCFRSDVLGSDLYTHCIGFSFPSTLTNISYETFYNYVVCNMAAFYFPKSFYFVQSWYSPSNNFTYGTFRAVTTAATNQSSNTTKQIVFQSGSLSGSLFRTITEQMFYYSVAKAIIIPPTVTTVENSGFSFAKYLQLINIFQKNAYASLTTTQDNAFYETFSAIIAPTNTNYIYLPKTFYSIGNTTFTTGKLYIYAYAVCVDGINSPGLFHDTSNNLVANKIGSNANNRLFITFNNYDTVGTTKSALVPDINFHVLFPPAVKTISTTFNGKTKLKSISISNSVTIINQDAFNGCTGLVNVWLSPTSSLTSIGVSAFISCTALTSIFIPNSVRFIYNDAFNNCYGLLSVTFGDNPGLKYIGTAAFSRCYLLTYINIPVSVIYVGEYAFTPIVLNTGLQQITFGAGSRLKSLGNHAFGATDGGFGCQLNTDIIWPGQLRFTSTNIFRNSRSNTPKIIFPPSYEYISHAIFYQGGTGYYSITDLYLPITITNVAGPRKHNGYTDNGTDTHCFPRSQASMTVHMSSSMSSLFSINSSTNAPFNGASTGGVTNSTPRYYKTVYYSGTNGTLTTLDLSNNVANTTDATNTTQVHADILDSVIVVGNGANSIAGDGSYNLISVNIPNTVTDISQDAFRGCGALVYVTFSEGSHLTTIGPSAFQDCSMIHDIQLPNSLTTFGANAFNGCTNLATISIPYNVTSMGAGAFHNTSGLLDVSGSSVRIHEQLYNDISGTLSTYFTSPSQISFNVVPELILTNTLHPSSLTISQINNIYIRYRQSQLGFPKITVNGSGSGGTLTTTDISNTILASGGGFVHLDISASSIPADAFKNNLNIYSVSIGASLTDISGNAFSGCTNLSYLSFHPDSTCTTIRQSAFYNNVLYDLALPDSLTTIGQNCFQSSTQLTAVCIPNKVTSMGNNAFGGCTKLVSIAVPSSTYNSNTYFTTSGNTLPSTILVYNSSSPYNSIPHFKLSDYSIPTGIIQNVIPSGVTYIDHRAYAYYPEISIYAINIPQTSGRFSYNMNGVEMPIMPAAYLLNGTSVTSNATFPVFRSVPDLNVYSFDNTDKIDDTDDFYILMPGYSICIYNNLYDEENLFTVVSTYRYFDNEFGQVPLNINIGTSNTTSSILILYNGCIVNKKFYN